MHVFETETQKPDDLFGHPIGAIYGKHAVGDAPAGSTGFNPRLFLRVIRMVIGWRIRGQTWLQPFCDRATRHPLLPATTPRINSARPPSACGPRPSAHLRR